jgi:hypothetical protein
MKVRAIKTGFHKGRRRAGEIFDAPNNAFDNPAKLPTWFVPADQVVKKPMAIPAVAEAEPTVVETPIKKVSKPPIRTKAKADESDLL